MKRGVLVAFMALFLVACTSKSELDQVRQENSSLRNQVSQLQQLVTDLQNKLQEVNAQLSAAQMDLDRKPAMPVKVSFRQAIMGPGYVAVFNTTVKQDFPVLVTVHSKALGIKQQFKLNLSQMTSSEIGHAQGAAIEPGDEIVVENNNYESLKIAFTK